MSQDAIDAIDTQEVQHLGYKPELPRTFGFFTSFAVGFSFISVTAGVFGSFSLGLTTAGGYMTWAWPLVAAGQTLVALVFGMLATRVPLAGSSYQWVSRMANPTAGWFQGWAFLTFVNISMLAVNYTLASTILPAVFGYQGTVDNTLLLTAAIALTQSLILIFSTKVAGRINNVAVITEILGTLGLSVAVLLAVTLKNELHLSHLFQANPGHHGPYGGVGGAFHSSWWELAFLMGIYSLCGFEGSADMSEETHEADRHVPRAMWMSMVVSGLVGFLFIGALVVSAHDLAVTAGSSTPIADIVDSALGGTVGRIFLAVVAFSVFACGLIIYMDTTRIVYAMARDERLPGWQFLRKVDVRLGTPLYAVVAVGVLDLVLLFCFGRSASALNTIVMATSVLPPIMYGGPCIVALFRRNRLPESSRWSLGRSEPWITLAAVFFVLLELFILRDSSLKEGWIYVAVAFGIGAVYVIVRRVVRGPMTELGVGARSANDPTPRAGVESAH